MISWEQFCERYYYVEYGKRRAPKSFFEAMQRFDAWCLFRDRRAS